MKNQLCHLKISSLEHKNSEYAIYRGLSTRYCLASVYGSLKQMITNLILYALQTVYIVKPTTSKKQPKYQLNLPAKQ
nr:4Fe-4S dicluster domain-containing protein [Bartonella callosciuri]